MSLIGYLDFIKVQHTVFALPFALLGYLAPIEGRLRVRELLLVLGCMVGARTAAMTFNRIVDRGFDARNPRTRSRHLVTGQIALPGAWALLVLASAAFVLCAWGINPLAFALSPLALAVVLFYSFTKRFTRYSHFVLGLGLGLAPVGGWIAATGGMALAPWLLCIGVVLWVAGFDLIYACQDLEFDRSEGLHSMVVSIGVEGALRLSSGLHAVCIPFFAAFGWLAGMGIAFGLGILVVAVSMVHQHRIISPGDLSRADQAFFTLNGFVSLALLGAALVDLYLV